MRGTCPGCGSRRVVAIEDGVPASRGFEVANQREAVLGGRHGVVPEGEGPTPNRACLDCDERFRGRRRRPQLT